jgi:hypothetical protein
MSSECGTSEQALPSPSVIAPSGSKSSIPVTTAEGDVVFVPSNAQATAAAFFAGQFKTPKQSSFARNRKEQNNGRTPTKRIRSVVGNTSMAKVPARNRVAQFPNQGFRIRDSKLFCEPCATNVGTKSSILKNHINGCRHKQQLITFRGAEQRQASILAAIDSLPRVPGTVSTIDDNKQLFRFTTVEAFVKAGVPLQKLQILSPHLERYGYKLGGLTTLRETITAVHADQVKRIKGLLAGQLVSVIFR